MAAIPFWNPKLNRWAIKIGYRHTSSGKRVRAWHYFLGERAAVPPPEVIADAVNKRRQWKRIEDSWQSIGPILEGLEGMDTDQDYSLPVWYDPELYAWPTDDRDEINQAKRADADILASQQVARLQETIRWGENLDTLIAELRKAGLLPKGVAAPARMPTIRQAVEEYLAAEEARTQLKIGERIDVGTFNGKRTNLYVCLGFRFVNNEPVDGTTILDLDKPLAALDSSDLKKLQHHWFNLPGSVTSRRTVKNYLAAFKSFLLWCEWQDDPGFTMPKAARQILRVKKANTPHVTKPDYALLKNILQTGPERTKMYAFLALFCGFNQSDICDMQADEVQTIKGQTYITGYRSKEDAEVKEDTKIKTTHWIPARVAEIMRKNMASKNPWGRYFLNRHGLPLFREKLKGGKTNAVSKAWEKATQNHKLDFKQLRKWGWNEIMRFGSNPACIGETLARRWAGQAGGGVSPFYRFEDYEPVIAAQRIWWKELGPELGLEKSGGRKVDRRRKR